MSFEDELRNHLQNDTPPVPTPGLGPEAVMRIGDEKRKRNRFQAAVGGFVVAGAAVMAVAFLPNYGPQLTDVMETDFAAQDSTDESAETTVVEDDRGFIDAASDYFDGPQPTRIDIPTSTQEVAGMTWTVSNSDLGWARALEADATGFYALSTAPGTSWEDANEANGYRIQEAVYYSQDGIDWEVQLLPDDLYASDFGASNGVMYLVGTSAATSDPDGPIDAWIATSTDQGKTWDRKAVDLDAEKPTDLNEYLYGWTDAQLAIHNGTALAMFNTNYWIDAYALAPDEYQEEGFEIQQTETGIEVRDFSEVWALEMACSEAYDAYYSQAEAEGDGTVTTIAPAESTTTIAPVEPFLEEFFPPECMEMEERYESLYNSTDNVVYSATWDELGLPDLGPLNYSEVILVEDGNPTLLPENPFPGPIEYTQLASSDVGFLATTWGPRSGVEFGASTWLSTDGRNWSAVPTPADTYELVPYGSFNGTLIAQSYNEGGGQILALTDGQWRDLNVDAALGPVQEGFERWLNIGAAGPLGVWATVQSYEVVEYFEDEEYEGVYEEGQNYLDIAFTTDLVNWSTVSVQDLTGLDINDLWVNQILVGTDSVYMTMNGYDWEKNETYSISLVGRP